MRIKINDKVNWKNVLINHCETPFLQELHFFVRKWWRKLWIISIVKISYHSLKKNRIILSLLSADFLQLDKNGYLE